MTTSTYSLISGQLPADLELSNDGTISGILAPVNDNIRSRFVIRETSDQGIIDQTFYIDVLKSSNIVWNTPEGYLAVGVNGESYALTNQWVNYSLSAELTDPPAGTKISYKLATTNDKLPPNLILYENGIITGYIKDQLLVDSDISLTGGYDTEAYDEYPYNHQPNLTNTATDNTFFGIPKIYKFNIEATDGISVATGSFKILVSSIDILNYNSASMAVIELPPVNPADIYVQYPQWIKGSELGAVRAENNEILPVDAYDPAPLLGTLTYSIIYGDSISTRLPKGLTLDSKKGYIYGFIPYQPSYTRHYSLTINASKTVGHDKGLTTVTATNVFSLTVNGAVDSTISWITTGSLGIIETGVISELAVKAVQLNSEYPIKYNLINGSLPPGLNLEIDGSISGQVNYGSTGTYFFTVNASDAYELSNITTATSITVYENFDTKYTRIWTRPFLAQDKRNIYAKFISNEKVFDPKLMYRFFDPNFGVQSDIKVFLEFGIEQLDLAYYTVALRENFYRKRFYFGDVKVAIAKDDAGSYIYDVVYVDVVDDMVNNENVSVSPVIYTNNDIYYPGSIDNMRRQFSFIALEDNTYIKIDENLQPKFMKTIQAGNVEPWGYTRVIPICYTLPNQGSRIANRIKLSGFDFKILDFEIDRIIVQKSLDNASDKYLIFDRQALGDNIITDTQLFGPNWALTPELSVRLDDENNNPINRK